MYPQSPERAGKILILTIFRGNKLVMLISTLSADPETIVLQVYNATHRSPQCGHMFCLQAQYQTAADLWLIG